MSANIKQVFDANPITAFQTTDLCYFGRSPYAPGNSMASTWGNILTQLSTSFTNINMIIASTPNCTISGVAQNSAIISGDTVSLGNTDNNLGTGVGNTIGNGVGTSYIGGENNSITGSHTDSAILTGQHNGIVNSPNSAITTGINCNVNGCNQSVVSTGDQNNITDSDNANIAWGLLNTINNADISFASGKYATVQSGHNGSVVITDSQAVAPVVSDSADAWKTFFTGGYQFLGGVAYFGGDVIVTTINNFPFANLSVGAGLGESWIFINGSDSTGTGGVNNPWATVTHTNGSYDDSIPAIFIVGAGIYDEGAVASGDVQLSRNKVISGYGASNTLLQLNPGLWNWSLSSEAWSGQFGSIEFNNIRIDSSITWDFSTNSGVGATGSNSYLSNMHCDLGVEIIGNDKTTDIHYANNLFIGGNSFFADVTAYWNNTQAMGRMYINTNDGDVDATINACSFTAMTNTLSSSGGHTATARVTSTKLGGWVIDGTNSFLTIDASSYVPCAFSFSNGADYTQVDVLTGSIVKWNIVSGTSQQMVPWNAYTANNAGLVTLTLPASAKAGTEIEVSGLGAGGWTIAQNASQLIHFNASVTTTGVGGSLSSLTQYNAVTLRCVVDSTTWVVTSNVGTLVVV